MKINKTIFFSLCYINYILCVDIGSDTAVTRFTTQVAVNNGDRIAGFAALQEGFYLDGTNISATFDSFFPVSGLVELNGSTLILSRDLILYNNSQVGLFGNIIGNGHALELAASVTCLPTMDNINECRFLFVLHTVEDDNVETLDWSYDNNYLAFGTDINTATQPLGVYSFNGNALSLVTKIAVGTGTATEINSVRWHPSMLRLAVVRQQSTGNEIFVYDLVSGSLILRSSAEYAANCTACAWHTAGNFLAVGGSNTSTEIRVYPVSAGGILGTVLNVNISPSRSVQLEAMDFSANGNYLAVGVNSNSGNPTLLIYTFTTAPTLTLNASINAGATVFSLAWNKVYTDIIAVGLTGNGSPRIIVYRHNPGAGTLTQIATLTTPFTSPIESIHWSPSGGCLTASSSQVGTGTNDARVVTYSYDNTNGTFSQIFYRNDPDDIGIIRYSPNGSYMAYGDDGFNDPYYLTVLKNAQSVLTQGCLILKDVRMVLNCDLCLQNSCLIFSGNSSINGRGYCLEIKPTCTVAVDSSATLLIKDVTLKGLENQQLQGLDMNSTISFENVTILLDNDFTFTQGRFDVLKDLNVIGEGHKFTYKSKAVSTIQEYGSFLFDYGVIFSYDPPIASKDLLQLTSDSSELVLSGATLHSTSTGLRLTKGKLIIERKSFITSNAMVEAEGISFGDGINSNNNLDVQFPGSLEIVNGCVIYNDA